MNPEADWMMWRVGTRSCRLRRQRKEKMRQEGSMKLKPNEIFKESSSVVSWLVVWTKESKRHGYVDEDTGEVLVVLEPDDPYRYAWLARYKTIEQFAAGEPLRFEVKFNYWNKRISLLREKLKKLLAAELSLPDPSLTWVVGDYDGFAR